jgi:hypothetical protein
VISGIDEDVDSLDGNSILTVIREIRKYKPCGVAVDRPDRAVTCGSVRTDRCSRSRHANLNGVLYGMRYQIPAGGFYLVDGGYTAV